MKLGWTIGLAGLALTLAACGGSQDTPLPANEPAPALTPEPETETSGIEQLELHALDCGTIEISNLDDFSSAGDWAGETDIFKDTCWLIRHPEGDLIWDTGVPGMLAGQPSFTQDIYTVSLEQTLTAQLRARGIRPAEIEYLAVSHSHFDHVGQVDQIPDATWLVHQAEYDFMFPEGVEGEGEAATQFSAFAQMAFEPFVGELDVFGDGSVIIFPTPGHTPGHTSLQVMLEETGPVLLSGDVFHRRESRELRRVPRFNTDEAASLASMDAFDARATQLGAKIIIQHEPEDIDPLPDVLR
ncbi:MAG: N-acyl homoserine lactonase family protein [Hyphomonadaceae bacterium]|nr:N-acyl homoserine lactonase family protein [Hyphomonadaceae bacterium]